MSVLGNFGKGPQRPFGWNPDRSGDRFAYRVYSARPENPSFRQGLLLAAALGTALLLILVFQKLNPTFSFQETKTEILAPLSQAAPLPIKINPVSSLESWGVVAAQEATVYSSPDKSKTSTLTTLSKWTLVAFDKKSSNGWFQILGVGWIQGSQVRAYPDDQQAKNAITQGRNQSATYFNPPASK